MNQAEFTNVFRAVNVESGGVHYFVGEYDGGLQKYLPPPPKKFNASSIIGGEREAVQFDSLSAAMKYKGYTEYRIASQAALNTYGWSKMTHSEWDINLGEEYKPYKQQGRRGRRKVE